MIPKNLAAVVLLAACAAAHAHFGILVPSRDTVGTSEQATIGLRVAFAHPMEQTGMAMEKPRAFYCVGPQGRKDLLPSLVADSYLGKPAWKATWRFQRPGLTQFVVEPAPYWEPAEDKFIVHCTKVAVPAFGEEEGWDQPVGAPAEIVPLTRPFANYAGAVFRGQVLVAGKPAAGCDVEIEYLNEGSRLKAPNDYFVTQVVKTDGQGIFTCSAPWAGWWGFAALTQAPYTLKADGKDKPVELGAVLWTHVSAAPAAK